MMLGLLGGHGQLGTEIRRAGAAAGYQIAAPDSNQLDIGNADQVSRWVKSTAADAWINAAAYTAVDEAESDATEARRINELGARNFAEALNHRRSSAPLIYFSTDYVFAGSKGTAYTELDAPDPQNVYGVTKLAGEVASLAYERAFVLRISWVFGSHGHNFVKSILRAARAAAAEGRPLRVVDDQFGAPCGTRSIARTVLALLARESGNASVASITPGLYHFSTTPYVSWHDFACAVVEEAITAGLLDLLVEVHTQPTSALKQVARRPADGRLDSSKLQAALGQPAPEWRDDLRAMLGELALERADEP